MVASKSKPEIDPKQVHEYDMEELDKDTLQEKIE